MSTTAEQLALINEAISTGATEINLRGKKIVYRSLSEMRAIRDELQVSVNGSSGPDTLQPVMTKGYT